MSRRDMAKRLGRSVRAVESRSRKLELRKFQTRAFTAKEDQIILAAKGRTSIAVAQLLGRAPSVVRMRAKRLGIESWKQFSPIREVDGYKVRNYRLHPSERYQNGKGKYQRVPEHRAVMEEHIGRRLTDRERVHHINCNKRDNRIENLHLCPSGLDHLKIHGVLESIVAELLSRGCIVFDRAQSVYKLCETHKH